VAAGLFHSDKQIWSFANGETKARASAPRPHVPQNTGKNVSADRCIEHPVTALAQATYTLELLPQARHDFEHTKRSKESIAFDLHVARSTLSNMVVHEGWRTGSRPTHWLPRSTWAATWRGRLAQVDPAIPLRTVHTTRGKWVRAERSRTKCAISAWAGCHRAGHPIASMRWSGR